MKKILLLFFFLSAFNNSSAQQYKEVYEFRIPKNLNKCFGILNKTMSDEEINLVKMLPEDSISYHPAFRDKADFFHAWKLYDGSRLTRYFNKMGLFGSNPIHETILISYHRHLNKKDIKLQEQIADYNDIQKREQEQYLTRIKQDTINGIYIPSNLEDCFTQLDLLLSDEDRNLIKSLKNRNETIKYHHGLGTWLRNNWGLWGGSRLQHYFVEKGLKHPDDMSALILEYYFDWLNNDNEGWSRW